MTPEEELAQAQDFEFRAEVIDSLFDKPLDNPFRELAFLSRRKAELLKKINEIGEKLSPQ